jgi:hypothetical protein
MDIKILILLIIIVILGIYLHKDKLCEKFYINTNKKQKKFFWLCFNKQINDTSKIKLDNSYDTGIWEFSTTTENINNDYLLGKSHNNNRQLIQSNCMAFPNKKKNNIIKKFNPGIYKITNPPNI